jgi:hypothetical protein
MKKIIIPILLIILIASLSIATPLSVVESKYIDTQDNLGLGDQVFMMTMRGDNSADYTSFVLPSQIEGETSSGEKVGVENGFKLESTITEENCRYTLYDDINMLNTYNYRIEKEGSNVYWWKVSDVQQNCALKGAKIWYDVGLIGVFDVYCLYEENIAGTGKISEGKFEFVSKFTLEDTKGKKISKIIDTTASTDKEIPTTINFYDNNEKIGIIKWIGGSTTGETCPTQDDLISLQRKDGQWITADKFNYIEYQNRYNDLKVIIEEFNQLLYDGDQPSTKQIENLESNINTVNNRANALVQNPTYIMDGSKSSIIEGSTATLNLDRDILVYRPDFQLFLKADFLNLVFLSGKPKITAAGFTNCVEGDTNNEIEVTIQNIGGAKGQFSAGLDCDSGIYLATTQRQITLDKDKSGTLRFPFSIDINTVIDKSCKITVFDTLNTDNKDTKIVESECSPTVFCAPEDKIVCRGVYEYKCINGNWALTGTDNCQGINPDIPDCNNNGVCDASLGESFEKCGGKTIANNDCATCNADGVCDATETVYSCPVDCGTEPPKDYSILYMLSGVLAATGLFFMFRGFGKKDKRSKRK